MFYTIIEMVWCEVAGGIQIAFMTILLYCRMISKISGVDTFFKSTNSCSSTEFQIIYTISISFQKDFEWITKKTVRLCLRHLVETNGIHYYIAKSTSFVFKVLHHFHCVSLCGQRLRRFLMVRLGNRLDSIMYLFLRKNLVVNRQNLCLEFLLNQRKVHNRLGVQLVVSNTNDQKHQKMKIIRKKLTVQKRSPKLPKFRRINLQMMKKTTLAWNPSGHLRHRPTPYFDSPSLRWSNQQIRNAMPEFQPSESPPPKTPKWSKNLYDDIFYCEPRFIFIR